jgi:hypothetical protein
LEIIKQLDSGSQKYVYIINSNTYGRSILKLIDNIQGENLERVKREIQIITTNNIKYVPKIFESEIYDLEKGKRYKIQKNSGLTDDLTGGVNIEPQYCSGGIFYTWTEASVLKGYLSSEKFKNSKVKMPEKKIQIINIANKISEFDNPIIIAIEIMK